MIWKYDGRKHKVYEEEGQHHQSVAIYGAGKGGILSEKILECCDIEVDCFFDNDLNKCNKIIYNSIKCLKPSDVLNKDHYCVLIGVTQKYKCEVYARAKKDGFKYCYSLESFLDYLLISKDKKRLKNLLEILYENNELELFSKIKTNKTRGFKGLNTNEKIAVYTGLFGSYDVLHQPKYVHPNVDLYIISDTMPTVADFEWIDAKNVIPRNISSPIKKNRFIKMHPHLIFPKYEYSIYFDSNIEILKDITCFIPSSDVGISFFKHHSRDCIFYEAFQIVNSKRVWWEDVFIQIMRYLNVGMPLHYGLGEMGIIGRRHNEKICRKIMETWWEEFDKGALRDQLSFMYVLWKYGVSKDDLMFLGDNIRYNEFFNIHPHKKTSFLVRNLDFGGSDEVE